MDRLTERNKLGEALLNANLNEKYTKCSDKEQTNAEK